MIALNVVDKLLDEASSKVLGQLTIVEKLGGDVRDFVVVIITGTSGNRAGIVPLEDAVKGIAATAGNGPETQRLTDSLRLHAPAGWMRLVISHVAGIDIGVVPIVRASGSHKGN